MPLVASSAITVPLQQVYDWLVVGGDPTAANTPAVVGAIVRATLQFDAATNTSPLATVGPKQLQTTTDSNGFWSMMLEPNANLNPANTTWLIQTPYSVYEITVGTAGPYQSTAVGTLVNTPSVLSPATSSVTGPLNITGNETVGGTLSVTGTTTLAVTTTGALTTAAASIGGDLTIQSAFRLLMLAATSKLVPGATQFSVRDNADANDNLLVTNAGNVTARGSLTSTGGPITATAGDIIGTAGRLVLNAAVAKIKGGATSLSLRNNADTNDNLLLTDLGLGTMRNALSIPPSAGGTVAATSYGTLPVKVAEVVAGGASGTMSLPGLSLAGFRNAYVKFFGQTSNASAVAVTMQLNTDATAGHYFSNQADFSNATALTENLSGFASGSAGELPASSTANTGVGRIDIYGVSQTSFRVTWTYHSWRTDGAVAGNTHTQVGGGVWAPTSLAAVTRIDLLAGAGFWVSGSVAEVWGEP